MLVRVKNAETADQLLEKMEELRKEWCSLWLELLANIAHLLTRAWEKWCNPELERSDLAHHVCLYTSGSLCGQILTWPYLCIVVSGLKQIHLVLCYGTTSREKKVW
jgi:hypothetical protein